MGWGQPPCYNPQSALRTPNLDKLASQGMKFLDAHSASAVCTPTRYGVLTGRYPARIGQFGVLTTYSPPIIPPTRTTVASLLKQRGYATACIGKWHLGLNWVDGKPGTEKELPIGARMTGGPNAIGFDYFCGFTHARNIGSVIEQDRVVAHVEAAENQPLMISKALEWIGHRKPGEPFFLYFPMCPPHTPIAPASNFVGKSGATGRRGQRSDVWRLGLPGRRHAWSDHGCAGSAQPRRQHLAHRGQRQRCRASGVCTAARVEEQHLRRRAPGAVRCPLARQGESRFQLEPHGVLERPAGDRGRDRRLLSFRRHAGEDSVSLLPALLGTSDAPTREATIHQSPRGDLAIRQGAWKLIFHAAGHRELFKLDDDLSETNNVLAANPEIATRLTALMQSYIDSGRSTPGIVQKNDSRFSLSGNNRAKSPRKARSSE